MNNMLENLRPQPVQFPDVVSGYVGAVTTIAGAVFYSMSYYQRGMCVACVSVTTPAANDELRIQLIESTDAAGTTTGTVTGASAVLDIAAGGNTVCGSFDFSSTDLRQNSGFRWVTVDGCLSHFGTAYVSYGFVFDNASHKAATLPDNAAY